MRKLIALLALVLPCAQVAHAQNLGGGFGGASGLSPNAMGDGFVRATAAADAGCGDPPGSPSVWLDADNVDGSDNATLANNDPVTTWVDAGSIGDDPTQSTGSAQPTFIASCVNSKPCVRFDTNDGLVATTASNFTFLSNGSDSTTYIVWRASAANPNALYALVTTASALGSSGARGAAMFYDDRSAASREDRLMYFISTGVALAIQVQSADDALAQQFWHTAVYKYDDEAAGSDAYGYVDGSAAGTATKATALSASDAGALAIGAETDLGAGLGGDITQVLVYAASHDDTTRAAVEDWIECEYGEMPIALATPPAANDDEERFVFRPAANDDVEARIALAGGR